MQAQSRTRNVASIQPCLARRVVSVKAQAPVKAEVYKVSLTKPLGVRFGRGNDGEAYVLQSDKNLGATDDRIQPGDKIVRVSASFGADVWDAKNFGQVMYAIRTRNGDVYMEFESRGGDMSIFEEAAMDAVERMHKSERDGGNVGSGTREFQKRNYIARKENERKRRELFEDALASFRKGDIKEALIMFEEVKAMEPSNFIGDNFSRVSRIYLVTQYNIACCYSSLKVADAALEAIEDCMHCGFDEFQQIREDKNLEFMRQDERFGPIMDKYDEPILNENAIRVLKKLFSFGKKE